MVTEVFQKLSEESDKYYEDGNIYPTPNLKVAAAIENALKSESDAIEIYLKLLEIVTQKVDKKIIQSIVADEQNHREKLLEMVKKYNKIPPNND
jgi:rubrerythrin